jgi:hypothetical protein
MLAWIIKRKSQSRVARIKSQHIVGASFVTLAWSAILGGIVGGWFTATMGIVAVVSAILHPIIGKLSSWVIHLLCQGIDWCYSLGESWGSWSDENYLWVAVFWPVTLPVMLSVCGVGLLFGIMYKFLFARDS